MANMNEISLVEYLELIGEPIRPDGHSYYRHKQHDSLIISVRKNAFYWNSRGIGGGPIQYLMAMYNMSYSEARNKFLDDINKGDMQKISVKAKPYAEKFNYKEIESYLTIEAKKYLVVERKINNSVVNFLLDKGLIAEEVKYHNIIFKWFKDGKFCGYSKQGTQKLTERQKEYLHTKRDFIKRVAPTTKEYSNWGFNIMLGEPINIYFFESPIDSLSYLSLNQSLKDSWLVSLEGGNIQKIGVFLENALRELKPKGKVLSSINICFDRDQAGEKFLDQTIRMYEGTKITFTDKRPKPIEGRTKTDWNDILKEEKNRKKNITL